MPRKEKQAKKKETRSRQQDPKPGEWTFTTGQVPFRLTAFERTDKKGLPIYTRIWDGRRYREKKALCDSIRPDGVQIDQRLEHEARAAAMTRQESAAKGVIEVVRPGTALTTRQGLALYLNKKVGRFAADTKWRSESDRASKIILEALGDDAEVLFANVKQPHYRKIWRWMATEHRDAAQRSEVKYGLRWTEQVLGVLAACARWLQVEGRLEVGEGEPARRWKAAMRDEWEQITKTPPPEVQQLRYTPGELEKLWAKLPDADPRLWAACEIGAELRLGQVRRSRRSDVLAAPDGHPIGMVRVHGKGKKPGELVVLDGVQRATLYYHLHHGYLRDLEAAYQAGKLKDYYLVPGGQLQEWGPSRPHQERNGDVVILLPVAQLKNADSYLGDTGLGHAWDYLEELAEVDHVKGRRWYGIRRVQSDRAEDVESDTRVLRHIGGWKNDETRRRYQQKGRLDLAVKAAVTRAKIRPGRE